MTGPDQTRTPEIDPSGGSHSRPVIFRMFILTMGSVCLALVIFTAYALKAFERRLEPEIYRKMSAVGRSTEIQLSRALGYGIPMDRLEGMPEFLGQIIKNNPEIRFIAVMDRTGPPVHLQGPSADMVRESLGRSGRAWEKDPSAAIGTDAEGVAGHHTLWVRLSAGGNPAGVLNLGVSKQYVTERISEIAWDVVTVLFVSLFLAYQFIVVLVNLRITFPIQQLERLLGMIQAGDFRKTVAFTPVDEISRLTQTVNEMILRVNRTYDDLTRSVRTFLSGTPATALAEGLKRSLDALKSTYQFSRPDAVDFLWTTSLDNARVSLFLCVFAEELSRSFLPLYIDMLYEPVPGLTRELVISLPISLFMGFIAVSTPWAGGWVERLNPRKVFLLGMIPAGAGFLGTALAGGIYELLGWRSLCAVGYAMQTMACQGYIARTTGSHNRAHGMAVFVSTIMIAAVCGTSIGGVLADQLGYRFTFGLSVVLILLSGVSAIRFLKEDRTAIAPKTPHRLSMKTFWELARNFRFSLLILFSAIPAKVMLTGFLFYLVPLYLIKLGHLKSEVGRMMMIYFILMVVGSPLAARLADRTRNRSVFVIIGGFMSGLGMLAVVIREDAVGVLAGITLFGVGQAFSTSPLIAMILDVTEKECIRIGQTSVLGLFRVLERVGSVAGPFMVAGMVITFGHAWAMMGTGLVMLGSTLLLLVGLSFFRKKDHCSG